MNQVKESFQVADTLAAYRGVIASTTTANEVIYPASTHDLPIGITLDTVVDTTSSIPVALNGIAKLYFNDSVVTGGLVGLDSSGRGVPFALAETSTAISAPAAYIGVLIDPKVADTGAIARIIINPGYDRVSA